MTEVLLLRTSYVLSWIVICLTGLAVVGAIVYAIVLFLRRSTFTWKPSFFRKPNFFKKSTFSKEPSLQEGLPLVGYWPHRELPSRERQAGGPEGPEGGSH
jgi:hypothetical protein